MARNPAGSGLAIRFSRFSRHLSSLSVIALRKGSAFSQNIALHRFQSAVRRRGKPGYAYGGKDPKAEKFMWGNSNSTLYLFSWRPLSWLGCSAISFWSLPLSGRLRADPPTGHHVQSLGPRWSVLCGANLLPNIYSNKVNISFVVFASR